MEDYFLFGDIDEISVVDALAEACVFTDTTDSYAYFRFEDSTFHAIRL